MSPARRLAQSIDRYAIPLGRALTAFGAMAWETRAESFLVLAMLGAWALFARATYVLALAFLPGAAPAVWPLAGALLLASGAGWKMLRTLAGRGLYALMQGDADA